MGTLRIKDDSVMPKEVSDYVTAVIRQMLGRHCPICGEGIQDNRYKKKVRGTAGHIYRASETSVTIECKQCGLRWMVTWRNFVKSLRYYTDSVKNDDKRFYESMIKAIVYSFDAEYSRRKPPQNK